tara:strand:+ start:864 stop:1394 length:531 start_codon:yes stop_codon:yes gene_type:complete
MATLTIFDVLFTNKKSKVYQDARDSLDRVKDIVTKIQIDYPDIKTKEIATIKNKWVSLSDPIGFGVHTMGLHLNSDYRSLLVHYEANGHMSPHFHSKEWEMISIIEGSIEDKSTGTVLIKGDVYIIPKGAIHSLETIGKECYMYVMTSSHPKHLKISDTDKETAKKLIGKHSFKAE